MDDALYESLYDEEEEPIEALADSSFLAIEELLDLSAELEPIPEDVGEPDIIVDEAPAEPSLGDPGWSEMVAVQMWEETGYAPEFESYEAWETRVYLAWSHRMIEAAEAYCA